MSTPRHDGPGLVSTVIDIILVIVILACCGTLLYSAYALVAGGVRKAVRWRRKRRAWLRGPGGES